MPSQAKVGRVATQERPRPQSPELRSLSAILHSMFVPEEADFLLDLPPALAPEKIGTRWEWRNATFHDGLTGTFNSRRNIPSAHRTLGLRADAKRDEIVEAIRFHSALTGTEFRLVEDGGIFEDAEWRRHQALIRRRAKIINAGGTLLARMNRRGGG